MRLVVLFLFIVTTSVFAETKIASRFGLVLYMPDTWRLVLLTPDELVKANKDDVYEEPLPYAQAQKMSGSGIELIYNTQKIKNSGGFYENITLLETDDQVPEAAAQIKSTCAALPSLLSHTLGRNVQLDICEGRTVQNYPAFVLSYAGDADNTRIVQYMLQLEQNRSLVLTLTHHNQNPAAVTDFETALQRLEFN